MPTLITKRGVKRWKAVVAIKPHPRLEKLFPDASKESQIAALQWELETKDTLNQQTHPQSTTHTDYLTVKVWSIKYLDFVKARYVNKTYKEKHEAFKNQLLKHKDIDGDTDVRDITLEMAETILKNRFQTGSGYAANKLRKNLSAAWTWGMKYLTGFPQIQNPFARVDPFPEIEQPRYVPPEEDFWTLLDYISTQPGIIGQQDRAILLTFLYCAGRRGEIWRLKLSDLDFSNNRIRLWTRKRKNGNYQADNLPMTSSLREVLIQWVETRLSLDTPDKEHVFISLEKTTACEQYWGLPFQKRQHFMSRNCDRAKVQPFGFHAIRHLTASILFRNGVKLGTIQAVLRHASKTTTERYLRSIGIDEVRGDLEAALKTPGQVIQFEQKKTAL